LQSSHISLKYKQYKYFFDDKFKLEFSKKIVYSKIENQIRLLKRYQKNYNLQCGIYLEKLKELQHKVLKVISLDQLR
jgi:CRISPR/Cas system-associated endonuclease Cas1